MKLLFSYKIHFEDGKESFRERERKEGGEGRETGVLFLRLFLRAVLGSYQNQEGGTEITYVSFTPTHAHLPLSASPTRVAYLSYSSSTYTDTSSSPKVDSLY